MHRQTRRRATVRERYITLRGTGPKSGRTWALKGAVAALVQEIANRRRSIVEWERELERLSAEQEQVRTRGRDPREVARAGQEFDRLVEHPDIEAVAVRGRRIVLTTRSITMRYQGTTYAIGRFRVTIVTDEADEPPRMVNRTRKIDGYADHPNVSDGGPLSWELEEEVRELIPEGRYADLAIACLRFLKHCDAASRYSHIARWPVAGSVGRRLLKKRRRRGRRAREARARYIALRAGGLKSVRFSFLAKEIAAVQEAVADERARLHTAEQQLAQYRSQFERKPEVDADRARYGPEFDRLLRHPDIAHLRIRGCRILVTTRTVILSHAGRRYDIGRFRIQVPADWSHDIRMVNLTRTVGGCHHPQGVDSEPVCLGNIRDVIQDLLRKGRYAAVISLCIQFLRSWGENPSDRSDGWPVVRGKRS